VLPAGRVGSVVVLTEQVVDGRELAIAVEAEALVGDRQVHDATRPEDAVELAQRPDRFLGVLDQVVGDHEVDRSVVDGGEVLGRGDDVDGGEREVTELGVVLALILH
jgi:hypothetical protein